MRTFHIRLIGLLCLLALAATGAYAVLPTPGVQHVDVPRLKRGYTVCVPAGLEEKKSYTAVIWLHPKGDSMNDRIRADWWGELDRRKIFLVLPESAKTGAWGDPDVPYLLALVADIAQRFPVDRKKIVLFGSELGGQMAFSLARGYSSQFASLITMSAYPVTASKSPVLSLPPDSGLRSLSILMVVSTADNGWRRFCREAASQMEVKGFSSGLVELPDAPQPYQPQAKPQILAWLDKVSAGERPTVAVPESERVARQAQADSAKRIFADVMKAPAEPEPKGAQAFKLTQAGLAVKLPSGWKLLADEPVSARLTTATAPDGPLLVQLSVEKDPKGLDHAVKDHETLSRMRGIRYAPVANAEMKLADRAWLVQQAACLSLHQRTGSDGKPVVVDVPSILTVCYWAPDPKSPEYVRAVFLYTDATAAKINLPALLRQVLSTVRILPKTSDEKPIIE